MQFSSRFSIATHVLLAIYTFDGQYKCTSRFLAESVNVNPVIIRNILSKLQKEGLIYVASGIGGAKLAKDPKEISLLDIFHAVEEKEDLFRFHEHPNPDCPVGKNIHKVLDPRNDHEKKAMEASLASTTLSQLIKELP